ncbi:MAG: DUF1704 domain-containing protein [Candidatus Omnitrophica bacterium]|nr:DUF1704 domain-containing protein [Candidatus Omnitrophota bacterium]
MSDIEKSINFYSRVLPLNQSEEKEKFLKYTGLNRTYNPVFSYKSRDLREEKRILVELLSVLNKNKELSDLKRFFADKIKFMIAQLNLLESEDAEFGNKAVALHGKIDDECLRQAEQILVSTKKEGYIFPPETITPEEMVSILKGELEKDNINWRCVMSPNMIPKITVSGAKKTIYINSYINYTQDEVERLKVHEIKVHIYRGENGAEQTLRIFQEGFAGYNETEEGLAIVAEEKYGCLKKDRRQMKLYAARALGSDLCGRMSFYEAFKEMREFLPEDISYRIIERGKRGMRDTSVPGGMTKGYHYISGWLKMKKYIKNGNDLSILYVGKVGLGDIDAIKRLRDKGLVKSPRHLLSFV